MARAGFATASISLVLVVVTSLACVAWADMAKDREECTEQLVGMATCLPYVQGSARAPTPDCCTGLRAVLSKSPKCLCVLVKDRDDPNLGLKINLTLALHLPAACSTPANISECPRLLKLPPGSPEAEVFKQPAKAADANATAGAKGNLTEAKESSGGRSHHIGRRSTWSEVEMIGGMLLLMLMPLMVLTG